MARTLVGLILFVYLLQNIAYSFYLKNVVIIDVMILALGFLLRVVAGVLVVHVQNFSPWLYVTVTLGALFLGFGKRRHEISLLEDGAGQTSCQSGGIYPATARSDHWHRHHQHIADLYFLHIRGKDCTRCGGRMLLTTPFVFYFIVRYLYLIHVKKLGGSPDELVLKDLPLLINSILWGLTCGGVALLLGINASKAS